MGIRIYCTALILIITVVTVLLLNQKLEIRTLKARNADTSIVRLHDVATGRFFCSGTVISDVYLLTAAHCVVREMPFGLGFVTLKQVDIRTQTGAALRNYAKVAAANPRQDLAVLIGDFRNFKKRSIVTNSATINSILLSPGSSITSCGYPDGGPLRCSTITHIDRMLWYFSGRAWMYPGMSGGPVLDLDTGAVVAVNQGVMEDGRVIISPLVELWNQLGLDESPNK